MLIKRTLGGLAGLILTLSPLAAMAEETLSKDVWLGKLKSVAPDLICKGFLQDESLGKRFKELNISYEKCVTLIPASYDKCQAQSYASIPATINQESASKWGRTIGECIGGDFAEKYLVGAGETNSSSTSSTSGSPNTPDSEQPASTNSSSTTSTDSASPSNTTNTTTPTANPPQQTTPTTTPSSTSPTTTSPSSSNEMPKDEWLAQIKAAAPSMICKGFLNDAGIANKFKNKNITYEKCITLIPASSEKCQAKLYPSIPAMINSESASKWGHTIGECIGRDFAEQHLLKADS